ncbi:hypothetical protein IHC93_19975 [Photobacterium damselae subsp. damselae]|uniref:hypothetical protein n=1 Tax=Photobacterium damselae TaxID=38293 RepID=UPI001F3B900D|nr:hypothetical protein [Photobacterium damselae]UKA27204.1 hypothetical protein IHC93_19975 [Photobacterium damselae subsp. damselae]
MSIEYLLSELDKQAKFKGDLKDDALLYLLQDGVDYALDILKLAKKINSKISIETEGLAKGGINGDSGTGTINVPAATLEQAIEGKSSDVAITPETLQAKIDDALKDISSVTFSTPEQVIAGVSADTVISPSTLYAGTLKKTGDTMMGSFAVKSSGDCISINYQPVGSTSSHGYLKGNRGTESDFYIGRGSDTAISVGWSNYANNNSISLNDDGEIYYSAGPGKAHHFNGSLYMSGTSYSTGDVIAFHGSTKTSKTQKDNSHYYPDSMPIDPETYDLIHIMRVLAWHVDDLRNEVNELSERLEQGS